MWPYSSFVLKRTTYIKLKIDMPRETYLIKIIKLYIFMVHLKHTNLYIFHRKYFKSKSEKFRYYHANNPLTIARAHNLSADSNNNPRKYEMDD